MNLALVLVSAASLAVVIALPITTAYFMFRDILFNTSRFFKFKATLNSKSRRYVASGSFLWLLACWCFLTYTGLIDHKFLPYPHEVVIAFVDLFQNQHATTDIAYSLMRIVVGFLIGATVGAFLGLLAGAFVQFYAIITPPVSFLRYIPPTAYIGLFVLWFGLGEPFKIALIVVVVLLYNVVMVTDEVLKVPKEYLDVAHTLGVSRRHIFSKVIIPASLPDIVLVSRVNMGAAWIMLIIAEYISSQNGLGHIISLGQRYLNTAQLFAAIILVGLSGLILDMGFESLVRLSFPWRRHYVG